MKLLKIEDGKREVDNFYLFSDFAEYAGNSNVTRDIENKTVSLISNNKIERAFLYEEFVIEVKKQNWNVYEPNDFCECYIGTEKGIYGIKDDVQSQNSYWKLLRQDGYIQAYGSEDGIEWSNVGGIKIENSIIKQGFKKRGAFPLLLENYKVYKRSFITILNFPENTIVMLEDEKGSEIRRRVFDQDMKAEIFLENCIKGKLVFTNPADEIIYTSDLFNLQYGDVYILSPYDLEIIYKGTVVKAPKMLDSFYEKISIKNTSTESYFNLNVSTEDKSDDLIQLSFDGNKFSDILKIDQIDSGQEISIYVRVYKSLNNHNFQIRDFQLLIE